jgi:hypothetical protein
MLILNFNRPPCSYFSFFAKVVLLKLFILWRSISIQNFMILWWLVQVLHPPQKFERPPYWYDCSYGIRNHGIEITYNGMTSLLSFIKRYQLVQKMMGVDTDLISLHFSFRKESRLKMNWVPYTHKPIMFYYTAHSMPH